MKLEIDTSKGKTHAFPLGTKDVTITRIYATSFEDLQCLIRFIDSEGNDLLNNPLNPSSLITPNHKQNIVDVNISIDDCQSVTIDVVPFVKEHVVFNMLLGEVDGGFYP